MAQYAWALLTLTYVATVALGMVVLSGCGMLLLAFAAMMTGTFGAETLFSSGSIQLSVTSGVLLLVIRPAVPVKGRTWAIVGTAGSVIGFEIIRILAEAVPPGPILGGWLIGLTWLGATVRAFRRWQQTGLPRTRWWVLPAQDRAALVPAPTGDPPLPPMRTTRHAEPGS